MTNQYICKFFFPIILLLLIVNCSDNKTTCPTNSRPKVLFTYPFEGEIDVPPDTSFTVKFDKRMDSTTISAGSFTLEGPNGTISAVVTFDSYLTATLTPLEILTGHTVYTARIDAGVRSIIGQQMDVPYAWSFKTGVSNMFLYPSTEYTIRDNDNDDIPDEFLFGGPPGRFLQTGVNGSIVDRAIIEFPLDQLDMDSVLDAIPLIEISSTTVENGTAKLESWGFIGNGQGDLSDWNNGSRTLVFDSIEVDSGQTIFLPLIDFINASLDSNATHVGLRVVITGEAVVGIATSGGITDDDKPRILIAY